MEGFQGEYNPTVSVVMPVYNQEKYLAKSIESVLYQTLDSSKWELTILDDGSTDKSREIMKDYMGIVNVRIILFDQNTGISNTLNTGIEASMGDYYVLCAPDDYMGINALGTLLHIMENQPEDVAAVYTESYAIDENDKLIESYRVGAEAYTPYGPCTVNAASAIIRMEHLERIKNIYGYIYDTRLKSSMDWDLWIRLSKLGIIKKGVGEPLTYYRLNPQGMSAKPEHEAAKKEVSRRLAFNEYGLPNPNISTFAFPE